MLKVLPKGRVRQIRLRSAQGILRPASSAAPLACSDELRSNPRMSIPEAARAHAKRFVLGLEEGKADEAQKEPYGNHLRQQTLTATAPMILDSTCSYARKWPKFATIRIDNRPETHPDIVMDNTNLQFPDAYFDAIYYDPPHVIRRGSNLKWLEWFKKYRRQHESRTSPGFFERYGWFESKTSYLENISGVNREFFRCLKPTGSLFCKIGVEWGHKTRCITYEEFHSRMTNFEVVKDRITLSKSNLGRNQVHWLTMVPRVNSENIVP